MNDENPTIKDHFQVLQKIQANLDLALFLSEKIKHLTSGWQGYAWKDGEYIDDIQEYFDEEISKFCDKL